MAAVQQANTWFPLQGKVATFDFGIFGENINHHVTFEELSLTLHMNMLKYPIFATNDGIELLVQCFDYMIVPITSHLILLFIEVVYLPL